MTMQKGLLFGAGILAGLLITLLWQQLRQPSVEELAANLADESAMVDLEAASDDASIQTTVVDNDAATPAVVYEGITVEQQAAGSAVSVRAVTLPVDGWVAVSEVREGVLSTVLGAVRRDAGSYTDVTVPLLRGTVPNAEYRIVLYADNGDRQFALATDTPLTTDAGELLQAAFMTE